MKLQLFPFFFSESFTVCCVGVFAGFLPSSFSMYAISLSSALFLFEKPAMAVAVAATGVILGWPFSILAFLPVTIYSLIRRFKQAFLSGAVTSLALIVSCSITGYNLISPADLSISGPYFSSIHLWLSQIVCHCTKHNVLFNNSSRHSPSLLITSSTKDGHHLSSI